MLYHEDARNQINEADNLSWSTKRRWAVWMIGESYVNCPATGHEVRVYELPKFADQPICIYLTQE